MIARVDGKLRLGLSAVDDRLWWENDAGERYVVDLAGDRQPRASDEDVPGEPQRVAAEIADGLVTLRGARLPIDDDHATISPDGFAVAGPTTLYRVADLIV